MTHPLLGVWLVEVDDAARSDVVHGFRADGTVLVTSAFHAAQGTWRPTGDRNADVVVMRPIESDDRSFVGWQAARGVVEVAEDGETYELSGSISRPTPGGGSDERPIIARGVRLRHDPVRHSGDPTDRDDGTGR